MPIPENRRPGAPRGRPSRRGLWLTALLWLGAVTLVAGRLFGQDLDDGELQATPLPPACSGLTVGVHSTLAYEDGSERRGEVVDAIDEQLRPQVVRDALLWSEVEPEEGERDWSSPDGVVEDLRAAEIEPLFVVLGSPPWATAVSESASEEYLHVPPKGAAFDEWLDRYSAFLAEAVERYKGVVRRWEIWNEPNLAYFWRPRPDPVGYRRLYETLRRTILRVDPNAEVSTGGLASLILAADGDIPGLAFLRRFARTEPPLDAVAVHLYTTDDHPPDVHIPGEKNFDDVERVHRFLKGLGEPAPVWVTEFGWSSAAVGDDRQAQYVDEALSMIEDRYPFVRLATYFADHDRPPEFFQGLLGEDLDPKPGASAFREHSDLAATRCARRGS